MAWTYTLSILTPEGSADPKEGDDRIRELKNAFIERLAQDHFFPIETSQVSNVSAGEHKKVTLRGLDEDDVELVAPTAVADKYFFYARYVDTGDDKTLELFSKDVDGNEIQWTKGGKFFIANDTYLVARNEDNDGFVNLIKAGKNEADDTEVAILPDGVRTATNAAPVGEIEDDGTPSADYEETAIPNRKYVDNEIYTRFAGKFTTGQNTVSAQTTLTGSYVTLAQVSITTGTRIIVLFSGGLRNLRSEESGATNNVYVKLLIDDVEQFERSIFFDDTYDKRAQQNGEISLNWLKTSLEAGASHTVKVQLKSENSGYCALTANAVLTVQSLP